MTSTKPARSCFRLLFGSLVIVTCIHIFDSRRELLNSNGSQGKNLRGTDAGVYSEEDLDLASTSFSIPPSVFFILLAVQCGCQPILVKLFMPTTIVRSTTVLAQEGFKLIVSLFILQSSGTWSGALQGWTFKAAFVAAGVPAGLYVIQNYCNVMATQTLPPVTFVVLNQTKTLSTALWCYFMVGQTQSNVQILALILLVAAALVIQKIVPLGSGNKTSCKKGHSTQVHSTSEAVVEQDNEEAKILNSDVNPTTNQEVTKSAADDEAARQFAMGVVPAFVASVLSGLAGTLAQRTLQESGRSPHLFNSELAFFSSAVLLGSLGAGSPDCSKIKASGVSQGWTWKTWLPIITNGLGGILVGLVTKYQGAVVKGFAMIFGMAISGALQQILLVESGQGVTREQIVGGTMGALSLWMHISYPPST